MLGVSDRPPQPGHPRVPFFLVQNASFYLARVQRCFEGPAPGPAGGFTAPPPAGWGPEAATVRDRTTQLHTPSLSRPMYAAMLVLMGTEGRPWWQQSRVGRGHSVPGTTGPIPSLPPPIGAPIAIWHLYSTYRCNSTYSNKLIWWKAALENINGIKMFPNAKWKARHSFMHFKVKRKICASYFIFIFSLYVFVNL